MLLQLLSEILIDAEIPVDILNPDIDENDSDEGIGI